MCRLLKRLSHQRTGKRLSAILLLLVSPILIVGVQHSDDWIKYTSKEGRYTVLLPSQPTVSTQEPTSAAGNKFIQYTASVFGSDVGYMVSYFDYPAEMIFTLDKARDGMVDAIKGTILSEHEISFGSYPGRDLRVSLKDPAGVEYVIHTRFYDIERRVYIVQFIMPKSNESASEKATSKYFDSFQVIKTP